MPGIAITAAVRNRNLTRAMLILAFAACASAQSATSNANLSPHFRSAVALENKGDVDGAISEYRLAIKDTPNHADSHYNLARLLEMAKRDHDAAIAEYREALRLRPDDPDVHNNLGLSLKNKGDLDSAAREYRETFRLNPNNAEAHINLGNVFYLQKNLKAATTEYRSAIQADPTNAAAHMSMANILDDQGETDGAIGEYEEAIHLQPDNANAHYNLSISLAKKHNKQGALAELREAARLAPNWPTPHVQLVTLLRQDDPRGALEECRIADGLTHDPKLHDLCEILSAEARPAASAPVTRYPHEITIGNPPPPGESQHRGTPSVSNPAAADTIREPNTTQPAPSSRDLFGRGSAFFLRRDYWNAAIYYQQALDLENKKPQLPHDQWRVLVDNLAMAYGIPGDLKRAQETLEYGLSKDPKYPSFYYTMACVYAEQNDLDRALSNLKTAFQYRRNLIPGEHMPDPRADDSFQRFKNDDQFQKLVASLPMD